MPHPSEYVALVFILKPFSNLDVRARLRCFRDQTMYELENRVAVVYPN